MSGKTLRWNKIPWLDKVPRKRNAEVGLSGALCQVRANRPDEAKCDRHRTQSEQSMGEKCPDGAKHEGQMPMWGKVPMWENIRGRVWGKNPKGKSPGGENMRARCPGGATHEGQTTQAGQHMGHYIQVGQHKGHYVQVGQHKGHYVQVGQHKGHYVQVGQRKGHYIQVGQHKGHYIQVGQHKGHSHLLRSSHLVFWAS